MHRLQRILIVAGGTGGHVFPGLAVAYRLQAEGVEVRWLGTPNGLEARVVPAAGVSFQSLSIGGVRGKGLKTLLMAPFRLIFAVLHAMRVIRRYRPNAVLGMGGYVSGPAGIASALLGYPLVIHEQNAVAGMTNRWLAPFAKRVLQAFPGTFPRGALTTGNPVRDEILGLFGKKVWPVNRRPLQLLVLGGSLGAQAINQLLPEVIAALPSEHRPKVWHQTGEKHFAEAKAAWLAARCDATVVPFIQAMEEAYGWADMVLCRAGALTISELCAAGRGAILIPYPHAVDDHQAKNAAFMVTAGAAVMIRQTDLNAASLTDALQAWLDHPDQCQQRGAAAAALGQGQAATEIVTICLDVARDRHAKK